MNTVKTPMIQTVYAAFADTAKTYPNHPFIHIPAVSAKSYHNGAVDYTYSEAARSIEGLRAIYQACGYGQGHRVALLLENRAEFFFHWFALNGLGVSVVPINGEMSCDEIEYLLEHSEVCLAISIAEKLNLLQQAITQAKLALPALEHTQLESLPVVSGALQSGANDQNECALLYTSGSTGKPKGCILNNEYFLYGGRWYRDIEGLCTLEAGKERLLTPLPLVHMNAMACSTMGMVMTGGCIIQLDRFHPSSWWQTVRESKATVIHYLGVMPAILLNLPDSDQDDFSEQLKFGFGAGINPKHHAVFEERFGFPLIEAWAMTESGVGGCIIANVEPRHIGTSCLGVPSAEVEYRLVDEQGSDVADGEQGELLVRRIGDKPFQGFFSGYLKNKEATDEALAGGWLHTGDVLRVGEQGVLHFVDRRKNVIRRSGENISALEVEAALSESPLVDNVVVVPVPDEIRGDEVMAAVMLKPGVSANQITADQIFQTAYDTLVYYKTPGYIAFPGQLPLTASGKPQRGELKMLARGWLQNAECFDLRERKRRQKKSIAS
jgi:acyl-CoA synthetase (AMP-forming)/AMP-acid ligase II